MQTLIVRLLKMHMFFVFPKIGGMSPPDPSGQPPYLHALKLLIIWTINKWGSSLQGVCFSTFSCVYLVFPVKQQQNTWNVITLIHATQTRGKLITIYTNRLLLLLLLLLLVKRGKGKKEGVDQDALSHFVFLSGVILDFEEK